jgi:stage III sporulation protein AF
LEELQTMVRNLAIILLLASFLEMLLPSKSMQGFVKLVMGLFVISAILNPVSSLLHIPLETSIPAWTESSNGDLPVLAAGNDGSKIGRNAVQEQYKEIIRNQVRALALGVPGVQKAEIEVEFYESSGGLTDQPRIRQIAIQIHAENQEIRPVEEVIIGDKNLKEQVLSKHALEVRNMVTAFMQLSVDQVTVEEK